MVQSGSYCLSSYCFSVIFHFIHSSSSFILYLHLSSHFLPCPYYFHYLFHCFFIGFFHIFITLFNSHLFQITLLSLIFLHCHFHFLHIMLFFHFIYIISFLPSSFSSHCLYSSLSYFFFSFLLLSLFSSLPHSFANIRDIHYRYCLQYCFSHYSFHIVQLPFPVSVPFPDMALRCMPQSLCLHWDIILRFHIHIFFFLISLLLSSPEVFIFMPHFLSFFFLPCFSW